MSHILCPNCNTKITKSYLKKHMNTQKCKNLSTKMNNSNTLIIDTKNSNNSSENLLDELSDDILEYIFMILQNNMKRGNNIYGNLRLVSKRYNNIILCSGEKELYKELNVKYTDDIDKILYMLSLNRYIGTKKIKENFCLTVNDIENLNRFEVNNGKIFLYNKNEVVLTSFKKNKNVKNLNKIILDKDEQKNIKQVLKLNIRLSRFKMLQKALTKCGMEIRKDSKLCSLYLENPRCGWSLKEVVIRMAQMKFLFEYRNMNMIKHEVIEELHSSDYFEDIYTPYEEIFNISERRALENIGGVYPRIFPWLSDSIENILE